MWSLGATIGPFIIGRFLVELPPRNTTRDVNYPSLSVAADVPVVNITVTNSYIRTGTLIIQLCGSYNICVI